MRRSNRRWNKRPPARRMEEPAVSDVPYYVNSNPEVNVDYFPALFSFFPELAERMAWTSLRGVQNPSVPVRMVKSRHLFGENQVYVRNEVEDFHVLPENKARKLEFVMGDVLRRRKKKVVAFGYVGSPHCLAVVKAAQILGLKSEVVLQRAHLTLEGLEMIEAMKNMGAAVRLRGTRRGLMMTAAWKWLCSRIFRTALLPPGPLNGLACFGYVSAMLELKAQIDDGFLPTPSEIFVAVGSGATLVGMEIGKRLAGLDSIKITGIQVSDAEAIATARLTEMANEAVKQLNQFLKKKIQHHFSGEEFSISNQYLFDGHGECPSKVHQLSAHFSELEGIDLDSVYTAKTFYALCDQIKARKASGQVFLFWNTYCPFRQGDVPSWKVSGLSYRLKKWIAEEQAKGHLWQLGKLLS